MYEIGKKKFQMVIDRETGRIAVNTNMWTTTNQKRDYMTITVHYVCNTHILFDQLQSDH
ncbi:hypothetical protein LINGRAPRIM_LOCUS304 [Linum grandiflorum]